MPEFQIITDGTRAGTQIIKDGEDLTNSPDIKVTSIEFMADASGDYVSISYTTIESYTDPDTEESNGRVSIRYSFASGEWMNHSSEVMGIGEDEAGIGGKVLHDMSGVSKVERLFIRK